MRLKYPGLYSVVYDARNYATIASYLTSPHNYSHIPVMNRVQLLSDLVLFTKYKLLGEDILMNHIKYFQYETDVVVWSTFSALLKEIQAIFNDSDLMLNISPIRTDLNPWSF
ncbi:hypothetical protein M8J75_002524 [Diaphorina citri]|nr:hypothetical protein M8J75_002524 [Diaphorina citri]